jgi:hypothetical protein
MCQQPCPSKLWMMWFCHPQAAKVRLHRFVLICFRNNKPTAADCLQESCHATWVKGKGPGSGLRNRKNRMEHQRVGNPDRGTLPSHPLVGVAGALVSSSTQLACSGHWGYCRFLSSLVLGALRRREEEDGQDKPTSDHSRWCIVQWTDRSSDIAAIPTRCASVTSVRTRRAVSIILRSLVQVKG